jgi:hypothetical protein
VVAALKFPEGIGEVSNLAANSDRTRLRSQKNLREKFAGLRGEKRPVFERADSVDLQGGSGSIFGSFLRVFPEQLLIIFN